MENGYLGWKNYETWAVFTHITNDDAEATEAAHEGEDALKAYVEELCGLGNLPLLVEDLVGAALDRVSWAEIRAALIEG